MATLTSLDSTDWFERRYSLEIQKALPLILPARYFVFPQRVEEVERGALHILVRPEEAVPWLGTFALGYASPHTVTGAFATPDFESFLAISGGYAYLANVTAPETTIKLKQEPIVWVGHSTSPALLLLGDFRAVTAISADGVAWTTKPLSMEGLTELSVDGAVLRGHGWDAMTDVESPWRVDLHSGEKIAV